VISETEVPEATGGLPGAVLALHRTTHHTLHALSTALTGLNLNAAEMNALANLGEGGTLNVRQLSERTGTRASTLTGVLDRLENRGFLTRELDPADRRSFRLPLTEAGQAAAGRVLAAVADLERAALARLSATQLAGYHAVITALQEAC
jgi:MarR family transcriptional regulator, organic hydroperoxide resistance regulator